MKVNSTALRPTAARWAFAIVLIFSGTSYADTPQSQIDQAIHDHAATVRIPAGEYRLADTLKLKQAKNLTIDGAGVTFIRADANRQGIQFDRCDNVVFSGFTIRPELVPFTQGKIASIGADRKSIDLLVDAGYPVDPLLKGTTGYVFDPATRQWKPGSLDVGVKSAEVIDGQHVRLTLTGGLGKEFQIAIGDLMAFRGKGAQDVYVGGCHAVHLDNVTIQNGSGFCVHEDGGDGDNHYTYTLTYGPRPAGATADPLIASNADAFHSSNVRHGPTLERCHFEGMCDDGIPIHGAFAVAVQNDNGDLIVAGSALKVGDPFVAFDMDGAFLGQGKTTEVSAAAKEFTPPPLPASDNNRGVGSRYFRVKFDTVLPIKPGARISNPAACGAGFVIRNCVIKNHRARGLLIKADDGLIEGNTIDGSTIADVVIAPEFWWNEAGSSRNITLRNNVFRHSGYATTGAWSRQCAAVTIIGGGKNVAMPYGHRHIVIENNRFERIDGANILIDDAADVAIAENIFDHPMNSASTAGKGTGVDTSAVINLDRCDDVRFAGNQILQPGAWFKSAVNASEHATRVSGVVDGVRLQK